MKVIGIVGEYNPFHKGHMHHISESRALVDEDAAVVCVMSGNFAQRGEPAVFSKFARAEAAVKSGADLVFELPLPWALSSAEGFARGSVGLLGAVGITDYLSFGSETGEIRPLSELAEKLIDPRVDARIKQEASDSDKPYAVVRQDIMREVLGDKADLLEMPNNILAVEYMKAIFEQSLDMTPVAVQRSGAMHDHLASEGAFRSSSELRAIFRMGGDAYSMMPRAAAAVFMNESRLGRGPVTISGLEQAVMSRLRMLPESAYDTLPDEGEGLGRRLRRAALSEPTLDAVYSAAKTKRFTMSRIRRMTMCAALGIRSGMADGIPPYARVLAANEKGCELLRLASTRSHVPIITKPASIKELSAEERSLFELECFADDLYVLGFTAREERRGGSTWRRSPSILQ